MRCAAFDCSSNPDESVVDFRARLAPLAAEKLAAERTRSEQQFDRKLAALETNIKKAEARVSSQRWQFFARLGTMFWVIADTVLSIMGKGLPGRRRSLDPAFRSVATERGQQANAQVSLDKLLADKKTLLADREKALADLNTAYQPEALAIEKLSIKPRKMDIQVEAVALTWLPYRILDDAEPVPLFALPSAKTSTLTEPKLTPP
jgi:hypothetical protein